MNVWKINVFTFRLTWAWRPCSLVSLALFILRPQCSNIFSITAWLIKAKFYVKPPWVGGTKVSSRHLGHMTKMTSIPIYDKTPSKISKISGQISTKLLSETSAPFFTKYCMQAFGYLESKLAFIRNQCAILSQFVCKLLGIWKRKFMNMMLVTWHSLPPWLYMAKSL